jgi:hypothetical protein
VVERDRDEVLSKGIGSGVGGPLLLGSQVYRIGVPLGHEIF